MPRPDRRSPRWPLRDYGAPSLYFITACSAARREVFGRVEGGAMTLSPLGAVAVDEWLQTLNLRQEVIADSFIVMPNHVHLLFGLGRGATQDTDSGRGGDLDRSDTMHRVPTTGEGLAHESNRRLGTSLAQSVSVIAGTYKAAVTRDARRLGLWADGPLWQGRFHDRVVRSPEEACRIRQYIAENPARWGNDTFHPGRRLPQGRLP